MCLCIVKDVAGTGLIFYTRGENMKPIEQIVATAEKMAAGEIVEENSKPASAKQVKLLFHELSELAKIVGTERARINALVRENLDLHRQIVELVRQLRIQIPF